MEILIAAVFKGVVLPPGGNLFAMLGSMGIPRRWRRTRTGVFVIAFASLCLCTMPWFAGWLAAGLETCPAFDPRTPHDAEALVVLGGGRNGNAREYGGSDGPGEDTLVRLRYGATLARELNLPVAVTGGTVHGSNVNPLGEIMADVLEQEYGVAARWIESSSRNTAGNASMLAAMPVPRRIILVTHASHMRRSVAAFERVGFSVVPAPTAFIHGAGGGSMSVFSWLPSARALWQTRAVLHEWVGIAYYAVRYRAGS